MSAEMNPITKGLMSALKPSSIVQAEDLNAKIAIAQHNVDSINKKLEGSSAAMKLSRSDAASSSSPYPSGGVTRQPAASIGDWTSIYQFCEKFEDVEELERSKKKELEKLDDFKASQTILGHNHDHSEERILFQLPDETKIKLCEKHRAVGNNLFNEGSFDRAADQFKTSLSYYEYIFPDSDKEAMKIDRLRYICLCNIALCYIRSGRYRLSIESTNQVILEAQRDKRDIKEEEESQQQTSLTLVQIKALYLRASAFSSLFEYDRAIEDLDMAILYAAERGKERDVSILQKEVANIKILKKGSVSAEKIFAERIFQDYTRNNDDEEGSLKNSSPKPVVVEVRTESKFVDLLLDLSMPLEPSFI